MEVTQPKQTMIMMMIQMIIQTQVTTRISMTEYYNNNTFFVVLHLKGYYVNGNVLFVRISLKYNGY